MTTLRTEAAHRYEFFQFVRMVELGHVDGVRGGFVGRRHEPLEEAVRFRVNSSFRFPATAIERAEFRRSASARGSARVDVSVSFLGLLGAVGELPWHYSEAVRRQAAIGDDAFREFADVLQHRSVSFFHRAWRKARLPFDVEASCGERGSVGVRRILLALVGLGTGLEERPEEGADRWIDFSNHFGRPTRSAVGLQRVLADACDCPVRVREFVGKWQALVPEEQTRLGERSRDRWRSRLGESAVLGSRVWDLLSCLEVELGPFSARRAAELIEQMRGGGWFLPLMRSYVDHRLDLQVRCEVDPQTIEPVRLGTTSGRDGAPLGCAAWISARTPDAYESTIRFGPRRTA